jgi:hypothetical protein
MYNIYNMADTADEEFGGSLAHREVGEGAPQAYASASSESLHSQIDHASHSEEFFPV